MKATHSALTLLSLPFGLATAFLVTASTTNAEDSTPDPAKDKAAFEQAAAGYWKEAFADPGINDWRKQWFLDGEVGTVKISPEGMTLTAGPEFKNGIIVSHSSGTPRPDPSNAEFREWWSNVVATGLKRGPVDGVFVDALPQALSPGLAKAIGADKAKAVVAGLREMIALTKRKIGADKILLANGTRTTDFREILDWEGIDGVMVEHFASFTSDKPDAIKADLDTIALAAAKGKFVVIKGWPGFNWLDPDMMKRPHAELLEMARERITFPLACFTITGLTPGGNYDIYLASYAHNTTVAERAVGAWSTANPTSTQ